MRYFFIYPTLLILFVLGACNTVQNPPVYADLTFQHLGKIPLNVAQITVDVTYDPPFASNYVDAEMPVSLSKGLQGWAKDRLIAVGQGGTARFRIEIASVIEDKLPQGKGIKGYFTKEQSERYRAKIIVTLDARSADGLAVGETQTVVERSITVAADASLNARDGELYKLAEKILADFDQKMEQNIRTYLARFLV